MGFLLVLFFILMTMAAICDGFLKPTKGKPSHGRKPSRRKNNRQREESSSKKNKQRQERIERTKKIVLDGAKVIF